MSESPKSSDERRREIRRLSCIPAYVESKGQHLALIRDVSPSGALLYVQKPLTEGERVHLELYLSGDAKAARPVDGKIVRVEKRTGPRDVWGHTIAVEFDEKIGAYADEIAELTRRQTEMGLFK